MKPIDATRFNRPTETQAFRTGRKTGTVFRSLPAASLRNASFRKRFARVVTGQLEHITQDDFAIARIDITEMRPARGFVRNALPASAGHIEIDPGRLSRARVAMNFAVAPTDFVDLLRAHHRLAATRSRLFSLAAVQTPENCPGSQAAAGVKRAGLLRPTP